MIRFPGAILSIAPDARLVVGDSRRCRSRQVDVHRIGFVVGDHSLRLHIGREPHGDHGLGDEILVSRGKWARRANVDRGDGAVDLLVDDSRGYGMVGKAESGRGGFGVRIRLLVRPCVGESVGLAEVDGLEGRGGHEFG